MVSEGLEETSYSELLACVLDFVVRIELKDETISEEVEVCEEMQRGSLKGGQTL